MLRSFWLCPHRVCSGWSFVPCYLPSACVPAQLLGKSDRTRAQRMEVVVEALSSLVPRVPRTVACPRKPPLPAGFAWLSQWLQNGCPHACSLKLCPWAALDTTGAPHKAHNEWLPSPPPALAHPVSSAFVHPAVIFHEDRYRINPS